MPCGRIVPPPQIEGLLTTTGWSNPGERQHPADLPLGGDDDHSSPRILHHHTSWVLTLAFSPDGTTLASGSVDCTICLWDVASGALRAVLTGHSETVTGVLARMAVPSSVAAMTARLRPGMYRLVFV